MLHLGIGGPGATRRARISMQQIANGQGDAYLVYINKAINEFGSLVYVRPMAEMNNPNALYHPSKGAGMSTQAYRKAFARIFLILHGGPRVKIDVALKRLGLPFLTVKEDLPPNTKGKLTVIWNPLAGVGGWMPSYPGDRYVDLVGNDMYGEGVDFSRSANEQLYAFARAHGKRYSLPEWGVSVDQPEFVQVPLRLHQGEARDRARRLLQQPRRVQVGPRARSRRARRLYRSCLTPLELMP